MHLHVVSSYLFWRVFCSGKIKKCTEQTCGPSAIKTVLYSHRMSTVLPPMADGVTNTYWNFSWLWCSVGKIFIMLVEVIIFIYLIWQKQYIILWCSIKEKRIRSIWLNAIKWTEYLKTFGTSSYLCKNSANPIFPWSIHVHWFEAVPTKGLIQPKIIQG